MEKIYANSEEKWLKAVVLYAIEEDNVASLFYDAEGTKPAFQEDLDWQDLFLKGLIRVCTNVQYGEVINPYMYVAKPESSPAYFAIDVEGERVNLYFRRLAGISGPIPLDGQIPGHTESN